MATPLTPTERARLHAQTAEQLMDQIARDQPLVKPHVQLLAVQTQALVSIALSLSTLISAAEVTVREDTDGSHE